MRMKETLSAKYLIILALVAAGILLVGARLRPRGTVPAPPSPTETALLEQRVRREQAAGIGHYLATRAAELAEQVVFLSSRGTSGVRYELANQILTVAGPAELVEPLLIVDQSATAVEPALPATARWNPDGWVLLIGRSTSDQPTWAAGIEGASRNTDCAGVSFEERVLNVGIDPSFAGGGAFNLNGELLGVLMPCAGTIHIVSTASIPSLLAASSGPGREFIRTFGFRSKPLPDSWKDLFPRFKGFLITDVWVGSWAERNGLSPGDLIVSEAEELNSAAIGSQLSLASPVHPGLTRIKFEAPKSETGMTLRPSPQALPELVIAHGTIAERSGLRSGDRLVSILGERANSLPVLSKLLAQPGSRPVRIVYERGRVRSVVEVPHE